MTVIDEFTTPAEAAEVYVSLGLSPIPVYGLKPDGRCQCNSPSCSAPGKHPVGSGWSKAATLDLDVVRDRFRNHTGNIGIALQNRHVLIDADGWDGLKTTDSWNMPPTLTAKSGSGKGGHWVFKIQAHQDPSKITDRRLPGLHVDVKVRGQFVAAPSMHASGNRYEWLNLCEPAPLPDELYALLTKRTDKPASVSVDRVRAYVAKMDPSVSGEGGHNQTYRVACFIAGQGLSEDEQLDLLTEYNERCKPPWSQTELRHKLKDARKNTTTEPLSSRDAPADEGWKQSLRFATNKNGDAYLKRTVNNAVIILRNDPRWANRIRKDEFTLGISVSKPPWAATYAPATVASNWRDSDTSRLQAWLQDNYDLDLSVADLDAAVCLVAEANEHNSARDWFDRILWDGQPRVDTWLSRYLGADDTPYTRAVGRWWLISAVARVYKPGCKADHMLILYGDQGVGKSSAAGLLAGPDWFSDSPVPIGSKDAYLALQGKLIVEMAELDSVNRAEASAVKQFLTSPTDRFRPPYGRRNVDVPRQCVFIGSTNHIEMLRDETGDRRFWPVTCGAIDREAIREDREQLWAETVALYRLGERWYPATADERRICTEVQQTHSNRHPWTDKIADWSAAHRRTDGTLVEILEGAIGMRADAWSGADIAAMKAALRQAGWRYSVADRRYHLDSARAGR